ncbi:hypothetical protein SAMN02910400_00327 [Lachnospiraceae bacterium C10]|nr:hypothetical protein SAMN02910400_00327 [Lachnospiraceae bacterium C10]
MNGDCMGTLLVVAIFTAFIILLQLSNKKIIEQYKEEAERENDQKKKMTEFYDILIAWMNAKLRHRSISGWLKEHNYRKIVIYGMRELGVLLYKELDEVDGISLIAVDKSASSLNVEMDVSLPQSDISDMDIVIVTAPHYFDEIRDEIREYSDVEVVSIEDIVFTI